MLRYLDDGAEQRCQRVKAELYAQLRDARVSKGITQVSLGAALGLSGTSIANWEGGRVVATGNLVLWAEALGLRLIIVDGCGRRCSLPQPLPPEAGEEVYHYLMRCLVRMLRDLREIRNLTQEELGEHLGVSAWSVQRWENGGRHPRLLTLIAWCEVLGHRLALATR